MSKAKQGNPKAKEGSQKTSRTPSKPEDNESVYQCELCLVTDNNDKVCCDLCQLWYHFKCVNVTSDIASQHWACLKCKGQHQQESTPSKPNEQNIPNPVVTSANDETENPPGAVGPVSQSRGTLLRAPTMQIHPDRTIDGRISKSQTTAKVVESTSETRVDKPQKSQKSVSISSSVSRRTALALQRLEEEKQLRETREREDQERREKHDREYLDKKYSLLEDDSEDEISLADDELDRIKRHRTQQWSEGAAKIKQPLVCESLELNLLEKPVKTKIGTEITNQFNRSEILQPSTQIMQQKGERARRFSQSSNASVGKVKRIGTVLPHWLTAPQKPVTSNWKDLLANPIEMIKDALQAPSSADVNLSPFRNLSLLPPQSSNRSNPKNEGMRTSAVQNMQSISSSSRTIVSNIPSLASKSHPLSAIIPPANVGPHSLATSTQPIARNIPKSTDFQLFAPVATNYNLPVMSNNNQSAPTRLHATSAIVSSSADTETFYFGLRPTTSSISATQTKVVQSSVSSYTIGYQAKPISSQQVNFFRTNPVQQSIGNGSDLRFGHGTSSVNVNNTPLMTTNQVLSSRQMSNGPPMPSCFSTMEYCDANAYRSTVHGYQPHVLNNCTNLDGPSRNINSVGATFASANDHRYYTTNNVNSMGTTFSGTNAFQSNSPIHNTNQNVVSGNMNLTGAMPSGMNDSFTSAQRVRLTAEQIAARHVIPKLPKFYGEPKYWQAFYSAYEYSTDACGFTNVENLGRLQESLKGDAYTAVGSRLLHPNSVPPVMSTLKLMYGRPELIIESMIESIKQEPSPKNDDLASLIKFAIAVQNLCGSIQETGALEHLRNPTLMNAITDKLPTAIQLNWAYYRHSIGIVDLSNLGDWLYGLADVASQVVRKPTKTGKKKDNDNKNNDKKNNEKTFNYLNTQFETASKKQDYQESSKKNKCPACKSESCSKLSTCKRFKGWPRSERWSCVKENKLCTRCLGNHSFYRCRSNQSCNAEGCTKKHHTLLHDNAKSAETSKNENKTPSSNYKSTEADVKTPTSTCNSQRTVNNRTDIFRIVPVVFYHNDKAVRDFVYLDDGSNLTLIEESLAHELELVGTPQTVCIDWAFGQSHESDESRIVTTKISGFYHQAPKYKLENVRTVKDLLLPTQSITSACLERYQHLKNIPIITYEAAKPRMLIGLQYSKLMVSLETIEGAWEEPIACRTRL